MTSIRRSLPHEQPLLSAIRREAIEHAPAGPSPSQRVAWAGLDPWRDPPSRAWSAAAEQRGEICGAVLLLDDQLLALYVRPSCQGGGIGSALLRAAEAEQQRRGRCWLRLQAAPSAVGFYRRRGYRGGQHETRWFSGPAGGDPVALASVLLWRSLAASAAWFDRSGPGSHSHGNRPFA